jgi:hypothetical protein
MRWPILLWTGEVRMSGNATQLYRILALSLLLLGTYTAHTTPTAYNVVSPATLQPGSLIPPPTEPVVLTVRGRLGLVHADAVVTFDIPTLERLGLIRFTTPTAWTDGLVTFEGVLLSRLLEVLAVPDSVTALAMTALNDYQVTIPVVDVRTWPVIIALKRDGRYMSVRNKGPLWVVYPRHAFPALAQAKHNSKWIWQLKEIVIH